MTLLEELNRCNDVPIHSVEEECFKSFGNVLHSFKKEELNPLLDYMEKKTDIPKEGNAYVPSIKEMEQLPIAEMFKLQVYGGMPIQIGYCNGRNSTYNGFEFHKGSEVNIALTDLMLVLGHRWDIQTGGYYDNKNATVFFLPKDTIIEMYQTTLHLSPLKVRDAGFKTIVILPKGTNTPLEQKKKIIDDESKLLLMKNKWVIAHPDRKPLINQGAFPGILGENKELFYPKGNE